MKRSLLLLLLLLATPAFALTIPKVDLSDIDDDAIELTSPVWAGQDAGLILVGKFESSFDRKIAGKLAGGFRNAMIPNYTLAPEVDLGEVLAAALRSEGTKLGLNTMAPQEGKAPQWTVDGTIRDAKVDIQHMGYGSLLFYTYLDVDVRVTKQGGEPVTHRIRPARLFVMYNGGMGMGDEVVASLTKILVVGAQQILARLNREHFQAPALPAMEARFASLKTIDDDGETAVHAIGLSGVHGASVALASRLERARRERPHLHRPRPHQPRPRRARAAPLRRFASEDDNVRYATIIALANAGTLEALALIREKGTKDKTMIVRKLSERVVGGQ